MVPGGGDDEREKGVKLVPVHIKLKRILIRNFLVEDWKDLQEIAIDKASSQYSIYDYQFPTSETEIKAITNRFANGNDYFAVCELNTNKIIGYICLSGKKDIEKDFGYNFHSGYWGKGYATEACIAIVDYAFNTLKTERITSGTANLNYPSVRLLRSLGFSKTGESQASFNNDSEGNPIEFTGSSYLLEKAEYIKKHRTE